jgi:hypothetical protein
VGAPPENASAQGVQAEAVVNDAHTLYLIVEADRRDRVEGLMAPFAQAGTVEVPPASSCDAMIGRRAAQHGGASVSGPAPGVSSSDPRATPGRRWLLPGPAVAWRTAAVGGHSDPARWAVTLAGKVPIGLAEQGSRRA